MNPFGLILRTLLEYYQPVFTQMDLIIGIYITYTIFKPGYASLPKKLAKAAIENGGLHGITVDFENHKLKTFYMNNFDFGVSLGLSFNI